MGKRTRLIGVFDEDSSLFVGVCHWVVLPCAQHCRELEPSADNACFYCDCSVQILAIADDKIHHIDTQQQQLEHAIDPHHCPEIGFCFRPCEMHKVVLTGCIECVCELPDTVERTSSVDVQRL
jgi:hypothetical protein